MKLPPADLAPELKRPERSLIFSGLPGRLLGNCLKYYSKSRLEKSLLMFSHFMVDRFEINIIYPTEHSVDK